MPAPIRTWPSPKSRRRRGSKRQRDSIARSMSCSCGQQAARSRSSANISIPCGRPRRWTRPFLISNPEDTRRRPCKAHWVSKNVEDHVDNRWLSTGGRGKLGAGCWFKPAVSRILKLSVKAKDVFCVIVIRNGHNDAVGKADCLRLVFELLKRCLDMLARLGEKKLTSWVQEPGSRFESGLMTAFLAKDIDCFNKDVGWKDDRSGSFTELSRRLGGRHVVLVGFSRQRYKSACISNDRLVSCPLHTDSRQYVSR